MILSRIAAYLLIALGFGPLAAQIFFASQTGQAYWTGLIPAFAPLALGLWLLSACYRRRPEIAVNPPWSAVVGDIVFCIALATGGLCVVDAARVQLLELRPWLDDFALREASAMMLLPAAGIFWRGHFTYGRPLSADRARGHHPAWSLQSRTGSLGGYNRI